MGGWVLVQEALAGATYEPLFALATDVLKKTTLRPPYKEVRAGACCLHLLCSSSF